VDLSWYRYHLAVVQPEHLVLVFHGLVVAIPNAALPGKPEIIAQKIVPWSERPALNGSS
jgi:hypothetical protein